MILENLENPNSLIVRINNTRLLIAVESAKPETPKGEIKIAENNILTTKE